MLLPLCNFSLSFAIVCWEALYTLWSMVCQESHWGCFQVPDKLHSLRLLDTASFHWCFWPSTEHLPPTRAYTRGCLAVTVISHPSRGTCQRKRQCWVWMDKIFCCLAIIQIVVWHFSQDPQDGVQAVDLKRLKALNMRLKEKYAFQMTVCAGCMAEWHCWGYKSWSWSGSCSEATRQGMEG